MKSLIEDFIKKNNNPEDLLKITTEKEKEMVKKSIRNIKIIGI